MTDHHSGLQCGMHTGFGKTTEVAVTVLDSCGQWLDCRRLWARSRPLSQQSVWRLLYFLRVGAVRNPWGEEGQWLRSQACVDSSLGHLPGADLRWVLRQTGDPGRRHWCQCVALVSTPNVPVSDLTPVRRLRALCGSWLWSFSLLHIQPKVAKLCPQSNYQETCWAGLGTKARTFGITGSFN